MLRLGSAVLLSLLISAHAFAAGRQLAPSAFGPANYFTPWAQTAFAGNRFLTIWTQSMGDIGYPLMGILHDASGRRISNAFSILPSAPYTHLTDGGDSFALFWSDGEQTFLTNIDFEGRVTRTNAVPLPVYGQFSWNGTRFVNVHVSYADVRTTKVSLLTRSGAIVHADVPLPDSESIAAFHVSPTRGGFALVTASDKGLCARRITNAGVVEWIGCVPIDDQSPYTAAPLSAPLADGGAIMVWTGGVGELRSAVVRPGGTVGPIRVLASDQYPLRAVHLGRAGDRHVLLFTRDLWTRYVKSLILDGDGAAVGPVREVVPDGGSEISTASSGDATLAIVDHAIYPRQQQSIVIANDGTAVGPPQQFMIGRARQTQPALADVGSGLLAAWTDAFAEDAVVMTSGLRTDGEPLFHGAATHGHLASRELPSNSSEVLVLSKRDVAHRVAKVEATVVSLDGARRGAETVTVGDTSPDWPLRAASAIWIGDRWLIVWANPQLLGMSSSIVHNGALTRTRTIPVSTSVPEHWSRSFAHLALSRTATTTLLVWTEEHQPICGILPPCGDYRYRTYAARLTPDGDFVDSEPLEIPGAMDSLSVATSGEEFVILTGGTAIVVDASARRVLRSTTVFGWNAAGDVTWTGSTYAVALRYKLAKWYLSVTHLDREGNFLGASRGIQTLAAESLTAPSMAGSVVALQEGDWETGARAVVYEESQLSALPLPPPSPTPRLKPIEDGWFEVTWDPIPGAELYVVETTIQDWWSNGIQVVSAEGPLRLEMPSAAVRITSVGPGGTSSPPPRRRSTRR